MYCLRSTIWIAIGIALYSAVMASALPALAFEYVIIEAPSDIAVSPGDVITDTIVIHIKQGDHLKLINSNGQILLLKGPKDGMLSQFTVRDPMVTGQNSNTSYNQSLNVIAALSNLLKPEPLVDNALGAVRGFIESKPPTDPWVIDVTQPDDQCIQKNQPTRFWRPDTITNDHLTLETSGGLEKVRVPWPADSNELLWMNAVVLQEGVNYNMETKRTKRRKLIIHIVPDELATRGIQAAWMSEQKCTRQALLLIRDVELD